MNNYREWTKEEAKRTFLFDRWGSGYFDVNANGHLCVHPEKENSIGIDINEVIEEMKEQKIASPAVIRFQDVLRSRVIDLNETFSNAIAEANYSGKYIGVYPIKVNQMREVVEEILEAGKPYNMGLEAGSKAELMCVLAYNRNPEALTILNGYKDNEYLRLALLGRKVGRKVLVVIEKMTELERLLELSEKYKVRPLIGLRTKLSIKCAGKWADSGGERAKFGLTTTELIQAVEILEKRNFMDCTKLLHFHLGSQITDIRNVKDAISEGARVYSKLVKMGVPLEYMDVGGGLGVDYDGTHSTNESSINYGNKEYASDVVWGIKQICEDENVPCPNIVSESGRAITAHHSCVITKVIGSIKTAQTDFETTKAEGEHNLVKQMRDVVSELKKENFNEVYNDAIKIKDDSISAFNLGVINLVEKAKIETLYWQATQKIDEMVDQLEFPSDDLSNLQDSLTSQYLCNFSVFQSAADSWAIGQLLPIMPIKRLNEKPNVWCSIADITCDSDGKIDHFINLEEEAKNIPLHELNPDEDYYVGIFLTGAYQDVMGDMHNLFGRLNEVHVYKDGDEGDFYIEEVIPGGKIRDVLSTMQYSPEFLSYRVKRIIDKEIADGNIRPREGVKWVDFYDQCLEEYTYLKT
ncbi:MAG: arginine decarboxylase [Halobacteriovorax sp.]|nr:arginine decarboxylase [Halobacteriovorax sp.]